MDITLADKNVAAREARFECCYWYGLVISISKLAWISPLLVPRLEFSCSSTNNYSQTLDDPLQFFERVILNRDGSLGLGSDHANPCPKKSLKLLLDLDQFGNGTPLGSAALVPRGPASL